MKRWIRWIGGMVEVSVQKKAPFERFLNLCSYHQIGIEELERSDSCYRFRMKYRDYRRIRPIVRKTKTVPYIKRRWGLPFVLGEWKQKKLFAGGFLLFFLCVLLLSKMIWSIDIEGERFHTEEALLQFLSEQGVYCGCFYRTLNYKQIEDSIRLQYDDISWVSVERVGSKLHIRLKESIPVFIEEKDSTPSHLVAAYDGVVESVLCLSGTPMVKEGDTVKKGDILISGIIPVFGDYETPVSTHLVRADGKVEISSSIPYYSVSDLQYEKKTYEKKAGFSLAIQGKNGRISFGGQPYEHVLAHTVADGNDGIDRTVETIPLCISKSFRLPIDFCITIDRPYRMGRFRLEQAEAVRKEQEKLYGYVETIGKKGVVVRENHVKIEAGNSLCIAKGTLSIFGTEQSYREITEEEWRYTESDEYNGNGS